MLFQNEAGRTAMQETVMVSHEERRMRPRMRYHWQMYFQIPDHGDYETGRMLDLSEISARFRVSKETPIEPGMHLNMRFSHPYVSDNYEYQVRPAVREGQVLRVDRLQGWAQEVAVSLVEPLDCPISGQIVPG